MEVPHGSQSDLLREAALGVEHLRLEALAHGPAAGRSLHKVSWTTGASTSLLELGDHHISRVLRWLHPVDAAGRGRLEKGFGETAELSDVLCQA